jgi:hypothetical protein
MLTSAPMRRSAIALLLVVSLSACGGKKDAPAPAASSATAASSVAHKPPKVASTPAPDESGDEPPAPKPTPKVDAIVSGLTKEEASPVALEKKVSMPSLGVEWSIPATWVVEDYATKLGREKEDRKGCHPPAVDSESPFFDVVAPHIDQHQTEEWNGQGFPVAGQKPNGGEDKWDWTPYAAFTLGAEKLPVIGTHRQEVPAVEPGQPVAGAYTHVWLFFKHPKTQKVGQIMLTWRSGDLAAQKILEAVAKTVTPL